MDEEPQERERLAAPYIGPGRDQDTEAEGEPEADESAHAPAAAYRGAGAGAGTGAEAEAAYADEAGAYLDTYQDELEPEADLVPEPEQPVSAGTAQVMAAMPPAPAEPAPLERAGTGGSGLDDRMREIQAAFIDDPRKAAQDADALVEDLLRSLSDELARRRSEFGGGKRGADTEDAAPHTEELRVVVQHSRELVDLLSQAREHARL